MDEDLVTQRAAELNPERSKSAPASRERGNTSWPSPPPWSLGVLNYLFHQILVASFNF